MTSGTSAANPIGAQLDRQPTPGAIKRAEERAQAKVGRQCWQSIGSIIGPAIFDRYVLAIDKAGLL
jgi:hypothetical protein